METTLTLISDKWKVLILRDLLPGTKRFGELKKSVGNVSQKVLTAQLRQMEDSGLPHPDRSTLRCRHGWSIRYRIGIQLETDFGRHVELGRGVSG